MNLAMMLLAVIPKEETTITAKIEKTLHALQLRELLPCLSDVTERAGFDLLSLPEVMHHPQLKS